jgi:hypothetical protein
MVELAIPALVLQTQEKKPLRRKARSPVQKSDKMDRDTTLLTTKQSAKQSDKMSRSRGSKPIMQLLGLLENIHHVSLIMQSWHKARAGSNRRWLYIVDSKGHCIICMHYGASNLSFVGATVQKMWLVLVDILGVMVVEVTLTSSYRV